VVAVIPVVFRVPDDIKPDPTLIALLFVFIVVDVIAVAVIVLDVIAPDDIVPTVILGDPTKLLAFIALEVFIAYVAVPANDNAVIVPEPLLMLLFCVYIVVVVIAPTSNVPGTPCGDTIFKLNILIVPALILPEPTLILLFCVFNNPDKIKLLANKLF